MEQQLTPEYIRANIEKFPLEDGGVKHLYRDTEGSVESVSYELYPGVNLIFKDVRCFSSALRRHPWGIPEAQ